MFDLRKFRKENKLTMVQLGEKLGYSHSYISNIETGKLNVSDNILDKLTEVFGINTEHFKSYNEILEVKEAAGEYKTNWKERYYNLLEKYNACLEYKEKLRHENERLSKALNKRTPK